MTRRQMIKKRNTLRKRNEIRQRFGGGGEDLPWQTFVGNPLQFTAPKAHTLRSTVVAFSPKQDLHGYSNPWPAGGGSNKLPYPFTPYTYPTEITVTDNGDGTVTVNGTCTSTKYYYFFGSSNDAVPSWVKPSTDYITDGGRETSNNLAVQFIFYGKNGETTIVISDTASKTSPADFTNFACACVLQIASGTYNNVLVKPRICEGTTATSWTPYSNICPISGWTGVDIYGAGENLLGLANRQLTAPSSTSAASSNPRIFDISGYVKGISSGNYYYPNNVTNDNVQENKIEFETSSTAYGLAVPVELVPNTDYYLSFTQDGGSVRVAYYDADGNFINYKNLLTGGTFKPPVGTKQTLIVFLADTKNVKVTFTDIMLNLGTSASPYAPYTGSTTTLSFPTTVYGGTIDLTTGVLTATYEIEDLGTLDWTAYYDIFYVNLSGKRHDEVAPSLFCTQYKNSSRNATGAGDAIDIMADYEITGFNYPSSTNSWLYIKDPRYATAAEFKTAMSGVMLSYPLATPVTYQLDPKEVRALKGINTMWTDGDTLTVEAKAEAVNLSALQSLNMLLGGRYVNNHTEEDLTDEEALDVILGGQR